MCTVFDRFLTVCRIFKKFVEYRREKKNMEKGTYFAIRIPKYCAGCGRELHLNDPHNRFDFENKNSFSCSCGVQFIQAEEQDLSKEITDELDRY